jgi:hypothetical protein
MQRSTTAHGGHHRRWHDGGMHTLACPIPERPPVDVLVCGGGPAGYAAAIAAGRLGARVRLIDAGTALGGAATSAWVNAIDCMSDGERPSVGGVQREMVERIHAAGGMMSWVTPEHWNTGYLMPIRSTPEAQKRVLDAMAAEAQVEIHYLARVAHVVTAGDRLAGVVVCGVDGLSYMPARTVIDATGDAAVAHLAGVPCREAKDAPSSLPATLCFIISGIAPGAGRPKDHLERAFADGHFRRPDRHIYAQPIAEHTISFNAGHVYGMDPTDPASLAAGLREGRLQAEEWASFLRRYVPGYQHSILVATAPMIGVRETRRIVGEYELTWEDFVCARHYPDQIGIYNKEADIHAPRADPETQALTFRLKEQRIGWLPKGRTYGLPYGITVPRGSQNLWVAGRCASTDRLVHSSCRVQPACAMMGQAAGTAAVQAIATGQPASDLDTEALVTTLRQAGAILPQPTLSRTMTRGDGHGKPFTPVANWDEVALRVLG